MGTYGGHTGKLRGIYEAIKLLPMGCTNMHKYMYEAAVSDLWFSIEQLWLQSCTYGVDLRGYRSLWGFPNCMYGDLVFDLCGSMTTVVIVVRYHDMTIVIVIVQSAMRSYDGRNCHA